MLAKLDQQLLAAHADKNRPELVRLYHLAGDEMLRRGDVDAGCFFLTHAYIFALEIGSDKACAIHAVLVSHGREA